VVLYGSAARDEYVEDRSDLNLLIIGPGFPPRTLEQLGGAFEPLVGATRTPPLLFSEDEWRRSADVFPIEIADMQAVRVVLRGSDPVPGLEVSRSHLRLALERELRGKLLRLRQGYAAHAGSPRELTALGIRSAATMTALLRAALVLLGETPPVPSPETIRRAAERIGFEPEPLVGYFSRRTGSTDGVGRAEFERYLAATEIAVRFIDQFHVGGGH
jgi:hypothetical protein